MHKFNRTLTTKWNENYFAKNYFLWKDCADDDMVKRFIDLGESIDEMDAKVGGGVNESRVVDSVRVSKLSWIHHNEQSKPIFDFLIDKIDRINYWHYGMHLDAMESIQYTRYPIGGHYKFHNDIVVRNDPIMRKMSLVLALTEDDEYEGGDFLLMPHGDNPERIRFKKGELIAFPSWIPHKVEPVTAGHRITAVSWVYGPKFV
jgi:PKHD-type hydroxylase